MLAAAIDIQKITATLVFDGTTSSGSGDAVVEFITGSVAANPIFDLRQTITAVLLDGAALPVSKVGHHDFGGGPDAQLRVIESVLAPNTAHTLHVTYTLGTPQASGAGSYQPAMTWSEGPRLAFNFGFTDLGPGRYLESWVPANLIFDQFELLLTLRVINTSVAHSIITNGAVTVIGVNHWTVAFPSRFAALSPLLEVRASDTVTMQAGSTTLPSGTNVQIETWKLAGSSVNLGTQITSIASFLANNEISTGPYIHGNRFVALIGNGAMEYEGGTTTVPSALQHETFHSWWARGLKPATQPDAWFDEAWTVYNDNGASGTLPFDFTEAPVTLCPNNPWVRITAGGSYTAGYRFFRGLASLLGVATLRSLMRDFYNLHKDRPATTTQLEAFLLSRTGNTQIVDAFHRFIYGFADPAPVPDLWLRDDPAHTGTDTFSGTFWNSPDLWIRNADDGGTTHQNPIAGTDNWFHARVRNRSTTATARHFVVAFNVKAYAGMEFVHPVDFLPCITAAAGFELAPGASTVVKARWPAALVPPAGTHACWLAAVLTRSEHPPAGLNVWKHNNLAQKNLAIIELAPDEPLILPIVIGNLARQTGRRVTLEFLRRDGAELKASLLHQSGTAFPKTLTVTRFAQDATPPSNVELPPLDCAIVGVLPDATSAETHFVRAASVAFGSGAKASIPLSLTNARQVLVGLRVAPPKHARRGDILKADLVQRDGRGRIVGGYALEIRVK